MLKTVEAIGRKVGMITRRVSIQYSERYFWEECDHSGEYLKSLKNLMKGFV